MRKTTRFTAMIAAMAMTMMSVGAMSASATDDGSVSSNSSSAGGSSTYDVVFSQYNTTAAEASYQHVYRVTVEWNSPTVAYERTGDSATSYRWNPSTHSYDVVETGGLHADTGRGWLMDGNPSTSLVTTATVKNSSDQPISTSMSFALAAADVLMGDNSGFAATINGTGNVAACPENASLNDIPTATITGTLNLENEEPAYNITSGIVLGTYTVTID